MYNLNITFLVTSEDPLRADTEDVTFEFSADCDQQAVMIAQSILDEYEGPTGVDKLAADGWVDPVVEDTLQADLYRDTHRLADLITGIVNASNDSRRETRRSRPVVSDPKSYKMDSR